MSSERNMGKGDATNNKPELPVDRGWAWVIAGAGVLSQTIQVVGSTANSLLFVEIMEKFDSNITRGSLMFMFNILAFSVTSVTVTTFIEPKFGERMTVITGGLILFLCSLSSYLAPNIEVFIASVAMRGVAIGFTYVPSMALTRYYFKKYRSIASVLPFCGGSAATIISPFLIRSLRKTYGISNTYLIMAALDLHMCLAGLLLRPVTQYRLPSETHRETDSPENDVNENRSEGQDSSNKVKELEFKTENLNLYEEKDSDLKLQKNRISGALQNGQHNLFALEVKGISADNHSDTGLLPNLKAIEHDQNTFPDRREEECAIGTDRRASEALLPAAGEINDKSQLAVKKLIGSSRETVSSRFRYGSSQNLEDELGTAMTMLNEDITDGKETPKRRIWQTFYHNASLNLWSFRMTLLAVLASSVQSYLFAFLPTITYFQGVTLDQAATLHSIKGAIDLVSRFLCGLIADTHILVPSAMCAICMIILGIILNFLHLASTFSSLAIVMVFIAMVIGCRACLIPVVTSEVVGTAKMPQAYGLVTTVSTSFGAAWNPIMGIIIERTGSFDVTLHIIGAGYIIGGLLLLTLPLLIRLDIKHGRLEQPQE